MHVRSVQAGSGYFKAVHNHRDAQAAKNQSRLSSIKDTLMQGKALRSQEMDYLQRHDPNLHAQAITLSLERQAYEGALQFSRSKADANYFNTFKIMQIAGQLKYGASEELLMRANTIQESHRKFVRSSQYAALR